MALTKYRIAYAAIDPSRAVGVMGDKRVYGYVCGPGFSGSSIG